MSPHAIAAIFAAALLLPPTLRAQAPDVPIESTEPLMLNGALLEKAKALREGGKLLSKEKVAGLLQNPVPAALTLSEPNTKPLAGREIAERARKGYLRLGWYFLCPRCDHWHLDLAGAYAISRDGAATCHHVLAPEREMREGYLIAVDHAGSVLPVTGILAKSQTMDVAILHIEGGELSPLPLNDQVAPGDAAFCFSDPLGQLGYLSRGIVNRFYKKVRTAAAPGSLDELKSLRVNVSTDWAPGSSGAAVLDECGNALGHVSTISPLAEDDEKPARSPAGAKRGKAKADKVAQSRFNGATLITLHEAIPARSVMALVRTMNEAAAKAAAEKPAQ
ncbi:MAG: serine protease [Chthoniobacteraceae bacterium]